MTQRLGLPHKPRMPAAKSGQRKDRRPYQEIIQPDERAIIEQMSAVEMAMLGYEW